ncbi:MAG: hypothetical protein U9Q66_00770 [Patescibacteria group bacterium]|nr:hypothetical protein [Patescibacteria group bacterium]
MSEELLENLSDDSKEKIKTFLTSRSMFSEYMPTDSSTDNKKNNSENDIDYIRERTSNILVKINEKYTSLNKLGAFYYGQ